ncbi:MAG TPA: PqqD family protein [Planctomycetota bacterium]|nr:PqqD family protein [Planctomycetota bacterium]
MNFTLNSRIEVDPAAVYQKVGDEIVFLHTGEGVYYSLNPVGSRAWELLLQHQRLQPVIDAMLDEFDVSSDTLRTDLLRIVSELQEKKIVRILPERR